MIFCLFYGLLTANYPPQRTRAQSFVVGGQGAVRDTALQYLGRRPSTTFDRSGANLEQPATPTILGQTESIKKIEFVILPEICRLSLDQIIKKHPEEWKSFKTAGWGIKKQNPDTKNPEYAVRRQLLSELNSSLDELFQIPSSLDRRSQIVMTCSIVGFILQASLSTFQPGGDSRLIIGIFSALLQVGCALQDFFDYETILRRQEEIRKNLLGCFSIIRQIVHKSRVTITNLEDYYTLEANQEKIFRQGWFSNTELIQFGVKHGIVISGPSNNPELLVNARAADILDLELEKQLDSTDRQVKYARITAFLMGIATLAFKITWLALATQSGTTKSALDGLFAPSNTTNSSKAWLPDSDTSSRDIALFTFALAAPLIDLAATIARGIHWFKKNKVNKLEEETAKLTQLRAILAESRETIRQGMANGEPIEAEEDTIEGRIMSPDGAPPISARMSARAPISSALAGYTFGRTGPNSEDDENSA